MIDQNEYLKLCYINTVVYGSDSLTVRKSSMTDWSHIEMVTNGNKNGEITIRNKQQAEHLHFMLSQMLELF